MKAQFGVFLLALEVYKYQLVIVYSSIVALGWKYLVKSFPTLRTVVIETAAAIAVLAVSAYVLGMIFYLRYPNYVDHGQPVVASISWLWMQGHELYPNWTTDDVFGLAYGPAIFLINGVATQLYASIFMSKLPGVLSIGVALVVTAKFLHQKTASNLTSLFLLALLVMLFGLFDVYSYWNRPEPFLILVSVLALGAALWLSPFVAVISVGVLTGIAVGFKLHGFFYTLPAAAAALARIETLRDRLFLAIIATACAVLSVLLPYLAPGVSIAGHLQLLKVALEGGWSVFSFIENLVLAFVLMAPIVGIRIWRKPSLNRPDRWLLAALGISIAMIAVIGAKAGGGGYYMLPLMPLCMYGIAVVSATSKPEAKQIAALIFISSFLAYSPNVLLFMKYLYKATATSELEKITELKAYLDAYPQAQIGISDDEHYSSYFYRVLSVWNGRPLKVDFTAWRDLADAGVDEEHIVRFIKGCTVPTWILPLGTPFTKSPPMWYESFRQTFLRNYRQIETGKAYQVWECKSSAIRRTPQESPGFAATTEPRGPSANPSP